MGRVIGICAAVLIVLVAGGYVSGCQEPADSLAAFRERHGVALESQRIATNGIELHAVQLGPADGEPVVLLHGYPEFWWGWHEQIARLAEAGFRVIVPDQRGYNASDKPGDVASYRVSLLAADIAGLLDALGHSSAYFGATDLGVGVAWELAFTRPELVRKLVIFQGAHPRTFEPELEPDATSEEEAETISWYRTFFQLPFLPEYVGRLASWTLLTRNLRGTSRDGIFPEEDLRLYRWAWERDGAMKTMVHWYRAGFRYPPERSGDLVVDIPTRIVFGGQDAFIPVSKARNSMRFLPRGEFVEVPQATHWILHEEPVLTSQHMVEFFGD